MRPLRGCDGRGDLFGGFLDNHGLAVAFQDAADALHGFLGTYLLGGLEFVKVDFSQRTPTRTILIRDKAVTP